MSGISKHVEQRLAGGLGLHVEFVDIGIDVHVDGIVLYEVVFHQQSDGIADELSRWNGCAFGVLLSNVEASQVFRQASNSSA